jgi:hypothetical protein
MGDNDAGHKKVAGGSVTWRTETLPNGAKKRVVVIRKRRGKVSLPADPKPAGIPKGTD